MSALRKLAVCYLVSVCAFSLAAGLRAWPDAADKAAGLFEDKVWRPAAEALARADRAFLDAPDSSNARVVLALSAPGPADGRTLAHVALPKIERPALVAAEPPGRTLIVATTDQQVVTDVRLDGAWTVPSTVLLARLG